MKRALILLLLVAVVGCGALGSPVTTRTDVQTSCAVGGMSEQDVALFLLVLADDQNAGFSASSLASGMFGICEQLPSITITGERNCRACVVAMVTFVFQNPAREPRAFVRDLAGADCAGFAACWTVGAK